jgi:subtilisin family serine protease
MYPAITAVPTYDPKSKDAWQVDPQIDLRSQDLAKVNMLNSLSDLLSAAFDSKTQWPAADRLPAGFDPQKIMEIGKDSGLGIRALHMQGITGKGVGIAIIDQTLLVDHVEYKDQIRVYEETSDIADDNIGELQQAQMHGAGIASIVVGKNVGVAPEADLYYIATGVCGGGSTIADLSCLTGAIKRVIEINNTLPADRKIKVLAVSQFGWDSKSKGYDEITATVNEARNAGIFVINPNVYESYGFHFEGLGREVLSDPNSFESYLPAPFWETYFYQGRSFQNTLLIPMDSRTTAAPTGISDYAFYRWGDQSWTIGYLTGMYGLAVQIKPDITPEEFWAKALATGKTTQVLHNGKEYPLGMILDPQALIEAITSK